MTPIVTPLQPISMASEIRTALVGNNKAKKKLEDLGLKRSSDSVRFILASGSFGDSSMLSIVSSILSVVSK